MGNISKSSGVSTPATLTRKQLLERDALALAELVYDMFKEEQQRENDIINDGQNNAQITETD